MFSGIAFENAREFPALNSNPSIKQSEILKYFKYRFMVADLCKSRYKL